VDRQCQCHVYPPDLKIGNLFCNFLVGLLPLIGSAAESLVRLACDVDSGSIISGAREVGVKIVKDLIESCLMKDRVKGSHFKSHQVSGAYSSL